MGQRSKVSAGSLSVEVVFHVPAEATREQRLTACAPIIDRFSDWMSHNTLTPAPLIRSEQEMIRQFLDWVYGTGEQE